MNPTAKDIEEKSDTKRTPPIALNLKAICAKGHLNEKVFRTPARLVRCLKCGEPISDLITPSGVRVNLNKLL
jgi:ribosomal protein S27E